MAVSMMKGMIVGNVGRIEPAEKTQNGAEKQRFSVAVNQWDSRTDTKTTTWWSCTAFGKQAETIRKFLAKGMPVTVVGDFKAEVVKKEDRTFLNLNLTCDTVVGMGRRDANEAIEGNAGGTTSAPAASVADTSKVGGADVDVDDIPF